MWQIKNLLKFLILLPPHLSGDFSAKLDLKEERGKKIVSHRAEYLCFGDLHLNMRQTGSLPWQQHMDGRLSTLLTCAIRGVSRCTAIEGKALK